MFSLTLLSKKGGTGKTTTAANLAAHLAAEKGWRILVVDLDSQANLSQFYLGSEAVDGLHPDQTVEALLTAGGGDEVIHRTKNELVDVIPAHLDMKITEEVPLAFQGYDVVIFDTPADTGSPAAMSGLISSNYALAPIEPESFGIQAIPWIQQAVGWAVASTNHELQLLGYFFNRRDRLAVHAVHEQIARKVHGSMVFETVMRKRVTHIEAMMSGQGVTEYAPRSEAAKELKALAGEVFERIESLSNGRIAA